MTTLPDGWRDSKFGEVFKVCYGKALSKDLRLEQGPFPVVGSAGVMAHTSNALSAQPSIVIGRKGNVGESRYFPNGCWPIDTTYFVPVPTEHSGRFIELQLEALELRRLDSSTTTPSLRRQDLEAVEIRVPPLDEQDEIVRILDTQLARLDSVLGAVQRIREKAAQFRRSLLRDAFNGQLTQPDAARGSDLPQTWSLATLGEVARWGSGGTPRSGRSDYYGGDIPWLQSGELNDGVVMRTEKTLTPMGLAESSAKWVDRGALLIAMYGATRGKVAIAGIPLTTNQAVAFAYPDPKRTSTPYLCHFLLSQRRALAAEGKGGAQPNLSQSVLKGWSVVLPPLPEQEKMIRILDAQLSRLDDVLRVADRVEVECGRLRRSLLQAAFSGELTREWREGRV